MQRIAADVPQTETICLYPSGFICSFKDQKITGVTLQSPICVKSPLHDHAWMLLREKNFQFFGKWKLANKICSQYRHSVCAIIVNKQTSLCATRKSKNSAPRKSLLKNFQWNFNFFEHSSRRFSLVFRINFRFINKKFPSSQESSLFIGRSSSTAVHARWNLELRMQVSDNNSDRNGDDYLTIADKAENKSQERFSDEKLSKIAILEERLKILLYSAKKSENVVIVFVLATRMRWCMCITWQIFLSALQHVSIQLMRSIPRTFKSRNSISHGRFVSLRLAVTENRAAIREIAPMTLAIAPHSIAYKVPKPAIRNSTSSQNIFALRNNLPNFYF